MRLPSKRVAALLSLLCLACLSCSDSHNAAPGTRAVVSSEPSPRSDDKQPNVETTLPRPAGFVGDYANVFDGESKARLESALKELKEKAGVEFAVVTVETTGGRPAFEYSLALAKAWGLGPEDGAAGGGMLLLLATKDREWRLQVSRSLGKDLPDEECRRLGDESVELYRKERYAEGLTKYADALVKRLEAARGFKLSNGLSDKR